MESRDGCPIHWCRYFVSILVMLEVKWKVNAINLFSLRIFVSILVMLEVKWKVNGVVSKDVKSTGFNPCYVGSKMESRIQ